MTAELPTLAVFQRPLSGIAFPVIRTIRKALDILTRSERLRLARNMAIQVVIAICDIGALALLLALVHAHTNPAGGKLDRIILGLRTAHALLPLAIIIVLFLLKNAIAFGATKRQYQLIYGVASRLSGDRLAAYFQADYESFNSVNPAVHTARISYQPMEFATNILGAIQQLSAELVLSGLTIAAILIYKTQLFLILMLLLLPPLLLAVRYSKQRLLRAREGVKQQAERSTQDLQEGLAGYVESNLYQRNAFFTGRYFRSHAALSATLANLQISQALPPRLMELFAVAGLMLLMLLGTSGNGQHTQDPVVIGAFLAAAYKIIPGMTRISNAIGQLRTYAYTFDPTPAYGREPSAPVDGPIEHIAFRNAGFNFGATRLPAMDFELLAGEVAGLSAASGKGKTTAINLLLGFLEPASGAILINGKTCTSAQLQTLWPRIAYVRQQAFFIHDSLLRNVTLDTGDPDPVRLERALRLSGLRDVIDSGADGLARMITDNGKSLSGGQRQRLAFARALYKDAPVMILDEPFSELDAASESALLGGLKVLAKEGKIILLVTHHAVSLDGCDKIIRLDA